MGYAQYLLGIACRDGVDAPRDPAEVREWLERASANGVEATADSLRHAGSVEGHDAPLASGGSARTG